ncbi:MAG: hypothetical protein KA746_01585 [Pyrinomonadaceae bacterium]|nr:hypothetical protein [Pyrinomonadaceae bacterium]MBP6211630.1 hypothetical protein [Pyrinomonadaceae bacterium]
MKITTTRITIERFTERIAYNSREKRNDATEGSPGRLSVAELAAAENLPADTKNEEKKTEGDIK